MKLLLGDCLDKLKELDDNSVDSIVTDPPYGLAFMGKQWDYDVPKKKIWKECLRVLKPGGHLLAFAGSRTYHRMAVRIENAGFEIRDQVMWLYTTGFPKSMDISKQIDKREGVEREVPGSRVPTSDLAKEWEGWGTALKPAHEPIVMARKPLSENTVVDNVLKYGTGGINIDESRIAIDPNDKNQRNNPNYSKSLMLGTDGKELKTHIPQKVLDVERGRFPSNIIFDEGAGKMLDEHSESGKINLNSSVNFDSRSEHFNYSNNNGVSRFFYSIKISKKDRNEGCEGLKEKQTNIHTPIRDKTERVLSSKNHHPTVKPTDLMLYLIRLVTPKGGTTLDPFMGSGSTGKAAVRGGFDFIGIEREKEYFEIAEARIDYEQKNPYIEETGKRIETNENSQKFW